MHNYNELNYFITIAQTSSFVQASKLLGISSSALSHSMRSLETRLNLRLFNRTTRHVSLTEAGQQLYQHIAPLFQSINQEVAILGDFLNTPSGTIRINAPSIAVDTILYPKLRDFVPKYPKVNIEIQVDNNWVDIVKQGFDMGCRLGNDVAQDMIAVQISKPLQMALVASPDYLKNNVKPNQIDELRQHCLIGMKISAQHGTELKWEFNQNGQTITFAPTPQFSINNHLRKQAALDGLGIAWLARSELEEELANGKLIELLPELAITYDPFYLYYPSRKGHSNVFNLVIDTLKLKN